MPRLPHRNPHTSHTRTVFQNQEQKSRYRCANAQEPGDRYTLPKAKTALRSSGDWNVRIRTIFAAGCLTSSQPDPFAGDLRITRAQDEQIVARRE